MLRDKSLVPLSHQHQHALGLCVRIDRAQPIPAADLETWRAEIVQSFEGEIRIHFAAEEAVLFPIAREFSELVPLIEDLLADHRVLRESLARAEAGELTATDLPGFAGRLSTHIRKEERQLFESIQKLLSAEELASLGVRLDEALRDTTRACAVQSEATRLRPGGKRDG